MFLDTIINKWNKASGPFCTMIVAAAGSSERMGGVNKLMAPLCGKPVLWHTLKAVDNAKLVNEIIVATQEESLNDVAAICDDLGIQKPTRVIVGGKTRMESVFTASLECDAKAQFIAVQDGARPLITSEEIDKLIDLAYTRFAVAPAIPVTDTIKEVNENQVVQNTPNRDTLKAVQTPQVFQADILKAALQVALNSGETVTDDCAAVEKLGKEIYLTEGNPENIKITIANDLVLAETIMKKRLKK